jgi:hypothetical protein
VLNHKLIYNNLFVGAGMCNGIVDKVVEHLKYFLFIGIY